MIADEPSRHPTKRITIDPVTRLEGHGKIEIFLDDKGNVANAYFQIPELRGFERFCIGRPVDELNKLTQRLCGVCPGAHHIAATKALDAVFGCDPPVAVKKLRELFYSAHFIHSHIAHFYALAAPDFVLGPAAPPEKRNILGLVESVGVQTGTEVIKHRAYAQKIQEIIGGKATHPVCGLPGGMSRSITEEERALIEKMAESCVEFSKYSLKLFKDLVLSNNHYLEIIKDKELYYTETYYMGLVDGANKGNFYEGKIRVVDQDRKEVLKFDGKDYLKYIAERVEPWSYMKFPYLKSVGWKGYVDGKSSGIYRVGPLARLNVIDGFGTVEAQKEYDNFFAFFASLGVKGAVHHTMAYHWARLIELVYASERLLELSRDKDVTSTELRGKLSNPNEGVGVVEAPRGTLFHHYTSDAHGITKDLNMVVATTNNNAAICMSVKKAASKLIHDFNVSPGLLNMVEMAFRAYDPCFSCGTHALPGQMPLEVRIMRADGSLHKAVSNLS